VLGDVIVKVPETKWTAPTTVESEAQGVDIR
jgi:ferredoxin, 2Fe-2S